MKFVLAPPLAAALFALGGCGTIGDTDAPALAGYNEARHRLQAPVQRNQTTYSEGLRCMGRLLERHGVNLSLLVEEISDKSGGKGAGVQDMLLSAFSQMTQRSGTAIRTVAYGGDTRNLAELMKLSGSREGFQADRLPAYALRGSISQYDENLVRATEDGGVSLGPLGVLGIGGGMARSTTVNLIAVDLTLVSARDWAIVPGVVASNVAAMVQQGKGLDAEVTYHKRLGANYSRSFARSDGRSVALRHLVELSAIEIAGRYGKVPYWECIGTTPAHPDVAETIEDWVASMDTRARLERLLAHFRRLGLFQADGEVDPALFKIAFRHYADALGADRNAVSDALMKAHFSRDPWAAGATARAHFDRDVKELPAIELDFVPQGSAGHEFVVQVSRPAYVQCFLQTDPRTGYWPLAQAGHGPLAAGRTHALRSVSRQKIGSAPGTIQALACMASANDRSAEVQDLWRRIEMRHPAPGYAQVRALRNRLAAQGGYVAIATLVARQPRAPR